MARDDLSPTLRGAAKSMASRRAEIEESRAFARAWRQRQTAPTAAGWDYPFLGHRTCAEWRLTASDPAFGAEVRGLERELGESHG